jgi:hypothetical protein
MAYTIDLDISHETPSEMVHQFASDHGCTAILLEEFGPAGGNPLYRFSSDNQQYLWELANEIFGTGQIDEDTILEMMVEV